MQKTGGTMQPKKLVVVEDDPDLCELLMITLEGVPLEKVGFLNGQAAMKFLRANPDSVLVLDHTLSDMNAIELIETLGREGLFFPFVLMTGYCTDDISSNYRDAGAREILFKDMNFLEHLPGAVEKAMAG